MKVLVIEDSERLRRSLRHGLRRSGFAVDVVDNGVDGLAYARHGTYDAIVLDLMLPRMDGITVLRRLRETDDEVHVLVLSAKDQVGERIEGLQLGADDYLTKPFDFEEFVARLRALIRRRYGTKRPIRTVGSLQVDTSARSVVVGGHSVDLTRNEYAILEYLITRQRRVVSKRELLDHLYAGDGHGSENAVEVFVHQLRKKIQPNGEQVIRTRRGHGYVIE